jgi:parvulin-like peptidyl-prolyl isomerase
VLSDLRKELGLVVGKMDRGQASGVVAMDGDYYILKVDDREKAGVIPFEEVRSSIEKELRKQETRRLYALWISRLKKDAYIEVVNLNVP